MRSSEYYGVQVPELGDRADITVVSQSIIDSEDNQSGKVENLKATLSGSIISLTSESRSDKLIKYYNGLAVQFISPVNAQSGTTYRIKIDNLAEQPYQNKVDIKVGDIVQAIYGSTGFITASSPMHNELARKATKINAGKGLTGGGDLSTDRTIDVGASDDSITVEANGIKVNTYDNVDSTSTTRPASAGAVKKAYDKANTAQETADSKLGKGTYQGDAQDLKNEIDKKVSKAGDIMTGILSIENYNNSALKLLRDGQNWCEFYTTNLDGGAIAIVNGIAMTYFKLKNNGDLQLDAKNLATISKEVVGAINESLWHTASKEIGNTSTYTDLDDIVTDGVYSSDASLNKFSHSPATKGSLFTLIVYSISRDHVSDVNWKQQLLWSLSDNKLYIRQRPTGKWTDWSEVLTSDSELFLGNTGIDKVIHIQDNVIKYKHKGYVDEITGRIYRCIKQAPANIVTPNSEYFEPADNISLSNNNSKSFVNYALGKSTVYGDIKVYGETNYSLSYEVESSGIYFASISTYLYRNDILRIYVNNKEVSRAPNTQSAEFFNGSCSYVGYLNKGDTIKFGKEGSKFIGLETSATIIKQ